MICVMTIAGSDSGCGAGIQGDLKTFSALDVYGTSVITAITSQNTLNILSIQGIEPSIVKDQMKAVFEDFPIKAIKIGMLYSYEITQVVVSQIKNNPDCHLVVDPILISTSGTPLLDDQGINFIMNELFPLAGLVTPNIPEMETLTPIKIKSDEDIRNACRWLFLETNAPILLKGGHSSDEACDILFDGNNFHYFTSKKINTQNDHGTGCALSSAIIVYLAQGYSLIDSVRKAKEYVTGAIEHSYSIGQGHGPLNHFWKTKATGRRHPE